MRTAPRIVAVLCLAGLAAGCAQQRGAIEATPPEPTIGGGVSIGGAARISATERDTPIDPAPNPVWTHRPVGASAAAVAASEVQSEAGFLERLRLLERQVAEGVAAGHFTETDLAQVRARLARAEAGLAETVGDLGRAKARFNAVVGPTGDGG